MENIWNLFVALEAVVFDEILVCYGPICVGFVYKISDQNLKYRRVFRFLNQNWSCVGSVCIGLGCMSIKRFLKHNFCKNLEPETS